MLVSCAIDRVSVTENNGLAAVLFPSRQVVSALLQSFAKRCRDMAFFAGPSEGAPVSVITTMAAVTGRWRRHFLLCGRLMTGAALQPFMCSCQCKLRLLVVVEAPECPTIGVVTGGTLGAQRAAVMFVFVARGTRCGRILECLRAMAFLAGHRGVQSDQGKSRQIVIERNLLQPLRFVVTTLTARAELAFVRIVGLVAGNAGYRELVLIEVTLVTAGAFDRRVCALEREFRRFCMVE